MLQTLYDLYLNNQTFSFSPSFSSKNYLTNMMKALFFACMVVFALGHIVPSPKLGDKSAAANIKFYTVEHNNQNNIFSHKNSSNLVGLEPPTKVSTENAFIKKLIYITLNIMVALFIMSIYLLLLYKDEVLYLPVTIFFGVIWCVALFFYICQSCFDMRII